MGRPEWCELVSGVCRLTGCVEEPEGSEHVSVRLSAEEDVRQVKLRCATESGGREQCSRTARSTGLTCASLSVESTGEQPVG